MTADEHLWIYDRIPHYWRAINNQDWKNTYVHEKPGITLSLISGTALIKFPDPLSFFIKNHPSKIDSNLPLENMLAFFRFPILIFNGVFCLLFFWLIRRITGNHWIALWSAILILLSPILLGSSQIVNADSLLWTFSLATILSYIAYLQLEEKKFAFMTSILLGLVMLTKFTGTILMPFLFVLMIIFFLERIDDLKTRTKIFFQASISYFAIIIGSLATFLIFLPAGFYKFKRYFYDGTIGYSIMPYILSVVTLFLLGIIADNRWNGSRWTIKFLNNVNWFWPTLRKTICALLISAFFIVIANYMFGNDLLGLEKIPFDARQGKIFGTTSLINKYFLEFRPVIFSLVPIVVLGCLITWSKMIRSDIKERFLVISLSSFILIYNLAVIQQNLLNILRYSLIVLPFFSVIAAIGLYRILDRHLPKEKFRLIFTGAIIFVSIFSLWRIKPFYFNYSSFLLPEKFIVMDSWGYGGYEAATYLNENISDAKNKIAWSDYYGFCDFFKGTCLTTYDDHDKNKIDYYILTRRGQVKYGEKLRDKSFVRQAINLIDAKTYYSKEVSPLWTLNIGDRPKNFVEIYSK